MTLRQIHPGDAPGVARVHVETWQHAYHGLVPSYYLDGLDVAESEREWRERITGWPERVHALVVEDARGEIAAFAAGGMDRRAESAAAGELYCLYVHPHAQRSGWGRRLCQGIARSLVDDGMTHLRVWVLANNEAGRRFYERLGGLPGETIGFELGGARLREIAYDWPDPAARLLC